MENIKRQIYDLVYNSHKYMELTKSFVEEKVKAMTPEEIRDLAMQELKLIEYFVRIELEDWDYWKSKKERLLFIIYIQNKKINAKN